MSLTNQQLTQPQIVTQPVPQANKPTQSLKWRFIIFLGVWVLISVLGMGVMVFWYAQVTEKDIWEKRQVEIAKNAGTTVLAFLEQVETTLDVAGLLDSTYLANNSTVMADLVAQNPAVLELIRLDANGQVVASAAQDAPLLSNLITIPQSSWFRDTIEGEQYFGKVQLSPNNKPYMIVASPAADGGVVVVRLDVEFLWRLVNGITVGKSGQAYIVNQNGQIVAHTDPEDYVLTFTNIADNWPLFADIKDNLSYTENFEQQPVLGTVSVIPDTNWILFTEIPDTESTEITRDAVLLIAIIVTSLGLVLIVAGWLLVDRLIFRRIGKLQAGAEEIGQGALDYRIKVNRLDEIGQVSQAFNQMTSELQSLYGSLEDQVNERTQHLEIVAILSEQLSAILNLEDLLVTVVNQIKTNFGYYDVRIFLFDEERENLVLILTEETEQEESQQSYTIPVNTLHSLVARAAWSGEMVKVDDVKEVENWIVNPYSPDTCSEMAVPIILSTEQRVVGVLDVQENEVAGLDTSDANLLRSLANQIAIAIRNARLFTEIEGSLTEARLLQAQYTSQSWGKATVRSGKDQYRHNASPTVTPISEETWQQAQRLAQTQPKPAIVSLGTAQDKTLIAPVSLGASKIGAFQLHSSVAEPEADPWTDSDLTLIEAVLDQVAQTAENLRLFNETRERVDYEQLIGEVTQKIRQSSDLTSLTQTAAEAISTALGVSHGVVQLNIDSKQQSKVEGNGNK